LTTPSEPAVLADLSDRLATIAHHHPAPGAGGGPDDADEPLAEAVTDTARTLLAAADVPDVGPPVTVDDLPDSEDTGIGAAPPGLVWAAGQVTFACDRIVAGRTGGLHDELTDLAVAHRRPTLAWRLRHAELDQLREAWPAARRQIRRWLHQAAPGFPPAGPPGPPASGRPGR